MTTVRVGAPQLGDVYVGRGMARGNNGTFGNPHPIGWCGLCRVDHDRVTALALYATYLDERLRTDRMFRLLALRLRGTVLWCPGNCKAKGLGCHADTLANRIDNYQGEV